MTRLYKRFTLFFALLTLSGCISTSDEQVLTSNTQSHKQRLEQLSLIKRWQVQGKIAFIQSKSRESATMHWQVDETQRTQQLRLSTYLGINVLKVESNHNNHTVQVDGQTYQDENLKSLIYSLTGLTIPVEALASWLKAMPYHESDIITYQKQTQFPANLISDYNNEQWVITYSNFHSVSGYNLPTKLTIKKDDLRIKIAINKWSL